MASNPQNYDNHPRTTHTANPGYNNGYNPGAGEINQKPNDAQPGSTGEAMHPDHGHSAAHFAKDAHHNPTAMAGDQQGTMAGAQGYGARHVPGDDMNRPADTNGAGVDRALAGQSNVGGGRHGPGPEIYGTGTGHQQHFGAGAQSTTGHGPSTGPHGPSGLGTGSVNDATAAAQVGAGTQYDSSMAGRQGPVSAGAGMGTQYETGGPGSGAGHQHDHGLGHGGNVGAGASMGTQYEIAGPGSGAGHQHGHGLGHGGNDVGAGAGMGTQYETDGPGSGAGQQHGHGLGHGGNVGGGAAGMGTQYDSSEAGGPGAGAGQHGHGIGHGGNVGAGTQYDSSVTGRPGAGTDYQPGGNTDNHATGTAGVGHGQPLSHGNAATTNTAPVSSTQQQQEPRPSGGGVFVGKVEHAIGTILGNESLKAKGAMKESQARDANIRHSDLAQAAQLEREAGLRRERAVNHGAHPDNKIVGAAPKY
ncbi:hypothetical protein GGX14DRAFT_542307 [Mycena pura]|uniref:Uncharacterized protein n=1 Tax=Mycena pura TaxID=153505 RepID=A0AAD6VMM7_9AGAR|nr:hypothetical protein GGX14DRAFT_542307 [Mycena pura]